MKYTHLAAGAATIILVVVFATARLPDAEYKTAPLDMVGIDTLEVLGDETVQIVIGTRATTATIRYQDTRDNSISQRRSGTRLIVKPQLADGEATIEVPSVLQNFVVRSASFRADHAPARAVVRTRSYVDWEGDVGELVLLDDRSRTRCSERCRTYFSVGKGDIGLLRVQSPDGRVELSSPGNIRRAELRLGRGDLTLQEAKRLDNIELLAEPGGQSAADAAADESFR